MNGIAFITTFSKKINFFSIEHIQSFRATQIIIYSTKMVNIYRRGGFYVGVVFMNIEFENISNDMEIVPVNTTAAREHADNQ